MRRGSCLCGAVAFETSGEMPPVVPCHGSQCRKRSGHFWAAT
ncbi:GFA family protein [Cereibacter sphaeroides]